MAIFPGNQNPNLVPVTLESNFLWVRLAECQITVSGDNLGGLAVTPTVVTHHWFTTDSSIFCSCFQVRIIQGKPQVYLTHVYDASLWSATYSYLGQEPPAGLAWGLLLCPLENFPTVLPAFCLSWNTRDKSQSPSISSSEHWLWLSFGCLLFLHYGMWSF